MPGRFCSTLLACAGKTSLCSLPIQIKWNDDLVTDSRAIYYGVRSRNEYRITRFGKGFPFLEEAHSGSLLVMTKMSQSAFSGFVLDHDTDIEGFLDYFDLAPPTASTD